MNGPSEIKFRDTEMKIHVDGRYLCTMHISRFVPVGRFKKREQDIQINIDGVGSMFGLPFRQHDTPRSCQLRFPRDCDLDLCKK